MPAPSPTFDLQSHSLHSDGALAAAEVVAAARDAGVELLSLTDHDTVDGVREAADAASGLGLKLATGVEISTLDEASGDLHILGYLVDDRDPAFLDALAGYRAERENRAGVMIEALRELGFEVDERRLDERAAQGLSIGRPHIADAVVAHPANAARLADESRLEPSAFLVGYLIEGAPAFRPRRAPSVAEAIATIHAAGGVAVWAHPFWDVSEPADVLRALERFRGYGIDGVEAFYATHTREQTELLVDHAAEHGLLTTGSADFHGPDHRQFNRFRAFETFGHDPVLGPIADL